MPREVQIPKVVKRGHQWFVMTRYVEQMGIDPQTQSQVPYLVAKVEHDITNQIEAILAQEAPRLVKHG